jgi:hypothetical protein
MNEVWIFMGGGPHPSGVFSTRPLAEEWIVRHGLDGTLTKYPLDIGIYEWALASGAFKPRRPDQSGAKFVGRFSSASLEHYRYEQGRCLNDPL